MWPVPTVVAMAAGDYVITVAAVGFDGCQAGEQAYPFYGAEFEYFGPLPGMEFWSVQGVDSAPPTLLHLVAPRSGALNFGWQTDVATRVYYGEGVADQFKSMEKCAFLREGPLVAKGIARFNFSDANDPWTGPGANQWGWVLKGELENVDLPACGAAVDLTMIRRWVTKLTADSVVTKLTASKGPLLSCR